MKQSTIRIIAVTLGTCILMLSGYLFSRVRIPQVVTHAVEESLIEVRRPSDRMVSRQIRALTERDPVKEARDVWAHEDPWMYGMRTGGVIMVPGIPNDSSLITDRILPVKVIAWTGLQGPGAAFTKLDDVAERYAKAFNIEIDVILLTN